MTTAQLLARARTLLDEVGTASFWTDAEIYSALTGGQQEVANHFISLYKLKQAQKIDEPLPQSLEALYMNALGTTTDGLVARPTGFWHLLSAEYAYSSSTAYKCRQQRLNANTKAILTNTYLAPSSTDPIVYVDYSTLDSALRLIFLPVPSGTATYAVKYLKFPTAISSGVDPTLTAETHEAILSYAMFDLLMKDQRPQEANLHLQKYIQELQAI